MHRAYVGSVERGERNIALTILTPATVLDTDVGMLLTGVQRQPQ